MESVVWKSDNESVVTVDQRGNLCFVGVGFATVIATSESGLTDDIIITVKHTDADGKWEFDGENHYHTCLHGTKFDMAPHSGGVATLEEKAVCDICKAEYGDFWHYVEHDMLSKDITALYNDGGTWYYIENGRINRNATTLVYQNGTWYYVENGAVNWGANLYFNFCGTEYRVVNGTVVF